MGPFVYDWGAQAGYRAVHEEIQNMFAWGRRELSIVYGIQLDGATRDSGASPTTVLRVGLALGIITGTKMWTDYDPTATDGSQICQGFLASPAIRMTDVDGNNQPKSVAAIVSGPVIASKLYNLDAQARAHCHGRFVFDDDLPGNQFGWRGVRAKTADYTVLTSDNNTIFTNQGATGTVIFTLPAIARGYKFLFYAEAAYTLSVVAATADTIVGFNDAELDSIDIIDGTNKKALGASLMVVANADATKWLAIPHGWTTPDTAGFSGFTMNS